MTIDRAIEILNPEHRERYDGPDEVNEACRMGMEALERTRWIPVSERLPEEPGKYLCCVKSYLFPKTGILDMLWYKDGSWTDSYDCCADRVTHWMAIPEPPGKGETENENHT